MTARGNRFLLVAIVGIFYANFGMPLRAAEADSSKTEGSATAVRTAEDGLVRVTVTAEALQIKVAAPFDVLLIVEAPEGSDVEFPDAEQVEQKFVDWNVLEQQRQFDLPTGESETSRLWRWRLTLETLRAEPRSVPSLEIRYRLPGESPSQWATIVTPELKLSVQSVVEETRDPSSFRDIKGTLQPPPASQSRGPVPLLATTAVGLAIVTAIAGWFYVRSNRKRNPADEARRCIAGLESDYREGNRTAASTVIDLDVVIRELIESSLSIPARALSRDELIQRLAERPQLFAGRDDPWLAELDRLMEAADQTKYAGRPLAASTAERFLKESSQWVDQLVQRLEAMSSMGAR